MSPRRTGQARENRYKTLHCAAGPKNWYQAPIFLGFGGFESPRALLSGQPIEAHKEKHNEHEARPLATPDPNFHMFVTAM